MDFPIFTVLAIAAYFLPTFLSLENKNSQKIMVLNVLLGWTIVGWAGALIWAMLSKREPMLKLAFE